MFHNGPDHIPLDRRADHHPWDDNNCPLVPGILSIYT